MNILLVRTTGFPPDLRIEKEAKSLLEAGHDVHLLCSGTRNEPSRDAWREMQIYRIADHNYYWTKLFNILSYIFRLDIRFLFKVRKLIKYHNIDIVCVYNTPIFPSVWFATWKLNTPIILVMLEYYPALLNTLSKNFLTRIKHPSFVCRFVDNLSTKYADYVIVMADELKEQILKNGKRSRKIEIVSNYHQIDKEINIDHRLLKNYENRFVLSYIGLVNASHRGVDIPIHAMSHIIKKIPEVLLLIVGSGRALPEMRELACELKLQDYVEFTDWVPFHLVPTYISASTVGLIPYRIDDHTDTTLPHKLFQYMALGKPVVASRARAIARIISQTKCGYVVPPEDPTTLSKTIISLYENKAGVTEMGRNGARWVADKYNWEAEFLKLNQIYLSFRRNSDKISALKKTP